jgi:ribose transport system substrate-binding protein
MRARDVRVVIAGRSSVVARVVASGAAVVALAAGVTACANSSSSGTASAAGTSSDKNVTLVTSIRSVANPYHAVWVQGAKAYARSVHQKLVILQSGDDSQKQLTDLQSFLASHSGKIVVLADPNTTSIQQALVRAVQQRPDTWIVTVWNKADGIMPGETFTRWIGHYTFDGVASGDENAQTLFKAMGGSGGIIALQGILDDFAAQTRFQGLKKALASNPKIKLLSQQSAEWDQNEAFNDTQSLLTKYGSQVKGIWAANDAMALGALQAVRAAKRKIPIVGTSDAVPQSLESIKNGTGIIDTTSSDAYWDGSAGLAAGYCTATGQFNPDSIPAAQRSYYAKQFNVDKANVSHFLAAPNPADYAKDWSCDHLWDRFVSPAN